MRVWSPTNVALITGFWVFGVIAHVLDILAHGYFSLAQWCLTTRYKLSHTDVKQLLKDIEEQKSNLE